MPRAVPKWIWNPESKILSVVYMALVTGVSGAVATVSLKFEKFSETVRSAIVNAGLAVQGDFAAVGQSLIGVQLALRDVIVSLGMTGGIAAPISVSIVAVFVLLSIGFSISLIVGAVKFLIPP